MTCNFLIEYLYFPDTVKLHFLYETWLGDFSCNPCTHIMEHWPTQCSDNGADLIYVVDEGQEKSSMQGLQHKNLSHDHYNIQLHLSLQNPSFFFADLMAHQIVDQNRPETLRKTMLYQLANVITDVINRNIWWNQFHFGLIWCSWFCIETWNAWIRKNKRQKQRWIFPSELLGNKDERQSFLLTED